MARMWYYQSYQHTVCLLRVVEWVKLGRNAGICKVTRNPQHNLCKLLQPSANMVAKLKRKLFFTASASCGVALQVPVRLWRSAPSPGPQDDRYG
jgi:hypothetical protein